MIFMFNRGPFRPVIGVPVYAIVFGAASAYPASSPPPPVVGLPHHQPIINGAVGSCWSR